MKAAVLAGGLGTRLQPYTFFLPKPMLPLADKPLLEYNVAWLKKNKITQIVICTSYLGKTIEDYFGNGSAYGVGIEYAKSEKPLGTAGQLKSAEKFLDDAFVCVYGDSVYDFDLQKMVRLHKSKKAFVTMALLSYSTKLTYGFIDLDSRARVKSWNEKPEYSGLINIGCYVMGPEFVRSIPRNPSVGMDRVFMQALKNRKQIYGHVIKSGFIDIGNRKSYLSAYKRYAARLGKI